MGYQIIKEPGTKLYNIFSSVSDSWVYEEPITEDDVLDFFVTMAQEDAKESTLTKLKAVDSGKPAYYQFTKTWDQAEELNIHTTNHSDSKDYPNCRVCKDFLDDENE